MQETVRQILETVKAAPRDNPVTKFQDNKTETWIEIYNEAQATETFTGNLPRRTPVRVLHMAFKVPYVHDYITKLCR
jgi:hypothetical protein